MEHADQQTEFKPLQGFSRHSETNLLFIDKEKTFNQQNILDNTGDILAQVVMALNTFNSSDEPNETIGGGIDLFSDKSILEDEWSIVKDVEKPPKKSRSRSKSLYPSQLNRVMNTDLATPQFTWSCNNNDIQDYINAQVRSTKANKDGKNVIINIDKPKETTDAPPNRRKSIFNAFNNVFKRRMTMANTDETPMDVPDAKQKPNFSPIIERRTSMRPGRKPQFNLDPIRRNSITSNQSNSSDHILESTTIADLIRALETAHVKNLLGDLNVDSRMNNFTSNRRLSMAPAKRRGSVTFNTAIPTPPSAGSNRYPMSAMRRSSLAVPNNRPLTMRQNSSPNRFSVTPVADSPRSAVSLSPIVQRRLRRFSAVPEATMMPFRNLSAQTTPHALRRNQFKQTISPLAVSNTGAPSFGTATTLGSVQEPDNE